MVTRLDPYTVSNCAISDRPKSHSWCASCYSFQHIFIVVFLNKWKASLSESLVLFLILSMWLSHDRCNRHKISRLLSKVNVQWLIGTGKRYHSLECPKTFIFPKFKTKNSQFTCWKYTADISSEMLYELTKIFTSCIYKSKVNRTWHGGVLVQVTVEALIRLWSMTIPDVP
jgi:hypothetical protein